MWWYVKNILIALDQLLNTIAFGWPDESLSARCWRLHLEGGSSMPYKVINALLFFDKDHCQMSWVSEKERLQSPVEERYD